MGVRDALLLNLTGSNFEALQSGDTARIKGDFSIKNTSDTEVFGVDVSAATVNTTANITSSMDISGSVTSTGSFGRVVASTFLGDGVEIRDTLVRSPGLVTSSAQIAADISGAFDKGFFFGFQASSSISGGLSITGSFGRLQGVEFHGDGQNIKTTLPRSTGILTSSAQIAADISGSFNKGFEFTGTITSNNQIPNAAGGLPGTTTIGASSTSVYSSRDLGMGTSPVAALLVNKCVAEAYDGTSWSNASPATPFNNNNAHGEWGTQNDAAFLWSSVAGDTYKWDGSSFSEVAHSPNNTGFPSAAGAGTSTDAGLKLDNAGKTECYNGSSWSELNAMASDSTTQYGMSGTTNDAMKAGGYSGGVQIWGGTNWSEGASLSLSTIYGRLQGTVNTALYGSGYSGGRPGGNCQLEEFNGTSWTTGGNLLLGFSHGMSLGANSKGPGGLFFGGESGFDAPGSADSDGCGGPSFTGATSAARLLQIYERPNTVTASFGRVENATYFGDGSSLKDTLPRVTGLVTGSAQLASRISGSFTSGFAFTTTSSLGSSSGSLLSASIGGTANLTTDRVVANTFKGDGSWILPLYASGLVTGSAQLAADISGSFNKGFTFSNQISGSATSSGSFGQVLSDDFRGDGSKLTNIQIPSGIVSSSIQISASISGAFTSGFEFTGEISGSRISTGSFGRVENATYFGDGSTIKSSLGGRNSTVLSGSKNIAADISGSFNKGFEFGGALTADGILSASYVGVSGSTFAYAGNATTMSISSLCGSDFDYRLEHEITAGKIKGTSYGAGVWSAGPNKIDDQSGHAGVGTQNSYLSAGGYKSPKDGVEKYNGSSWAASAPLLVEHCAVSGFGTQNAAAMVGGHNPTGNDTELYNGATFSNSTPMGSQRRFAQTAGTQNAGLVFSGTTAPGGNTDQVNTETFNGNVWTEVNNLNIARGLASSGGTQNAAIIAGGYAHSPGAVRSCSEIWNGTNWTAISDLNTARSTAGGMGTQNHFVVGGGGTPSFTTNTEEWNGTTWSEQNNLGTARSTFSGGQGGLGTAGILAGGQIGSPTATNTVEFWNNNSTTGSFGEVRGIKLSGDATNISASILSGLTFISASSEIAADISGSFTSGFELFSRESGSANQRKSYYVGVSGSAFSHAGNATTMSISSLCGSDFDYRLFDTVNQIKGSSYGTGVWSNATAMPVGARARAMAGTQNAFLSAGSYATNNTTTQKFNGSSWSVSAALNNTGRTATGVGTQNAMATFGGMNPGYVADDKSELYNGATWSNGNNMGTTRSSAGSAGTQNAAIIYGGVVNSPAIKRTETELYNGDVFTETADLSVGRGFGSSGGTQNDAIMAGGLASPTGVTCTEIWNGTSWTEVANLNTLRWNHTGIGTANHHLVVTGHPGSTALSNVEEWNGDSWSEVSEMSTLRAFAGPAAGGLGSQGIYAGGYAYPSGTDEVGTTELWNATATTTGSFGLLKPRGGGINTEAFQVTSSLFKLPVFSDKDLNYSSYEGEYNTGSLSGSVDRDADVIVGQNLGEMWFDSDKNAVGYTYSSSSLISQSLNFGEFANISASGNYVSCSQGFFSQSFYNYAVVTCYLTGSQV